MVVGYQPHPKPEGGPGADTAAPIWFSVFIPSPQPQVPASDPGWKPGGSGSLQLLPDGTYI